MTYQRAANRNRYISYDPINGGRIPIQPAEIYDQWREKVADLIAKTNR